MHGSSPRVRGKLQHRRRPPRNLGLIPACAGKTAGVAAGGPSHRAHPRVCGENAVKRGTLLPIRGSSPRVRGKPVRTRLYGPQRGLIPACAGKTPSHERKAPEPWAHPRVCGENIAPAPSKPSAKGSSPRVRGKLGEAFIPVLTKGLIPACAGKTLPARLRRGVAPAHPRVCGENSGEISGELSGTGSSPRVRGKPLMRSPRYVLTGLIPACAGKTPSPALNTSPWRAHPRVCGENPLARFPQPAMSGSSPRVRGKPGVGGFRWGFWGLIPACAGKTRLPTRNLLHTQAHPRVCGENSPLPWLTQM